MRYNLLYLQALLLSLGILTLCPCCNNDAEEDMTHGYANSYDVNTDYKKLLNAFNANDFENISYKDKIIVEASQKQQKKISGKGVVSVTCSVIPLYVHQSDGKASGEYYIVDATVSVASKDMYTQPTSFRFDKDSKTYTYCGMYLKSFDVEASLERKDGSKDSITFDKVPVPETSISSTTYNSGITWGVNGIVSGGAKGLEGTVEANLSYTSSKTRSISDLTFKNNYNKRNGLVSYSLKVNNLPKEAKKEPPIIARSTLDFHFSWVWYLPKAKANDETTQYKMKLNVTNLVYEGIGSLNQRKVSEALPNISKVFELPVPNRIPSGSVDIENDSKKLMTNIKYTNLETSKVYADTTTSSYGKGMHYKRELPVGEYILSFKLGGKECRSDIPIEIVTARNIRIYSGFYK